MAELIESCEELGLLLDSSSNFSNVPLQTDQLLEIEAAVSKVRSTCQAIFDASTDTAFQRISSQGQQSTQIMQRSILRGRALSLELRKRVYREKKAAQYVLDSLDTLYSTQPERQQEIADLLLDMAALLEGSMATKSTLRQNIDKVRKPGKVKQQENSKLDLSPSKAKELQISTSTESTNNKSQSMVEDTQEEGVTALFPFLRQHNASSGLHRVLVVGKEGSGKTHICNEIERGAGENLRVHRLNVVGRTIGELEDNILSFFDGVRGEAVRHMLLVDDFDDAVGSPDSPTSTSSDQTEDNEGKKSHASTRAMSAFLTAMDSFVSSQTDPRLGVTLVCTARSNINLSLVRFDTVHMLKLPTYEERRTVLAEMVGHSSDTLDVSVQSPKAIDSAIDDVAELCVGLSYAEIGQNCRQAIIARDKGEPSRSEGNIGGVPNVSAATLDLLDALKAAIQSFAPASLRGGVVDGFVDMRVSSSEDLQRASRGPPTLCPLFGFSSALAWKDLESNIVIPLCRAKELNRLLFGHSKASIQGGLSCGVVLTGPPGSGKTTLARHCATFASTFLPSIKLLEVSCTSLIHKEVGGSEKAIHHLFECARNAAPCVVILDDVAVVSSVRGRDNTTEGTMDRVLSTILTELDGVERDSPASGDLGEIAVIGVTQNVNWVDPALLRPGRLGRIITLDAPDLETRQRIALREVEVPFDKHVDSSGAFSKERRELSELIADQTEGLTGSSVVALCNDAKQSCIVQFAEATTAQFPSPVDMLTTMTNYVSKVSLVQ